MDEILDDEVLIKEDSKIIAIVKWWETRRLPFNIIVGFAGIFSMLIFGNSKYFVSEIPFVLIYGLIVNVFYSLGWGIEILLIIYSSGKYSTEKYKGIMFFMGTIFSIFITVYFCFFAYLIAVVDY